MLGTENPISMTKDSNEVESPSHTSLMHVAARVEAKNASSHFKLGQMDFTCSAMAVAWRMYRAWIKSKDKDKCCFNILIFIWLQGECQNCVIRRAGFNVIIIIATHALILRAGPDRSLKPYDLHPVATHPPCEKKCELLYSKTASTTLCPPWCVRGDSVGWLSIEGWETGCPHALVVTEPPSTPPCLQAL